MRRAKTDRVPKTHAGGEWTQAAFFAFLRSGLRGMSRRWPPIVRHAMQAARRKYVGPNKRQKWEYQCAFCQAWFMGKEVKVDHIVPAGSLRSMDDLQGFVERLFVDANGLRIVCVECHKRRHEEESMPAAVPAVAKPVETVSRSGRRIIVSQDKDKALFPF